MLLLLTALTAPSVLVRADSFDCRFEANGRSFDLNPIQGTYTQTNSTEMPPSTSKSTFSISPCQPLQRDSNVKDTDQCPENTRACLVMVNQKEGEPDRVTSVVPIAGGVGELDPTVQYLTGRKGLQDALQIDLHGGRYLDRQRWARLTLYCDPSSEETAPTRWNYRRTETEGVLSVDWKTKYACPLGSDNKPPSGDGSPSRGTSIGSYIANFFLLLFVVLVAYFVTGAYYQYSQYGSRGWDLLPNRAFWSDLPYVLRDLCRGSGRGSSGYSSL